MLSKFFKKYSFLEWLFILTVIPACMAIFQSDTTLNPYLDVSIAIRVALAYLIMFYCVVTLIRRSVSNDQMQLMGIYLLWWFITVFHTAPGVKVQWNVLAIIMLLVYAYFHDDERIKIFELYRIYIVLMSVCGILCYAFFLLKVPFPCKIVPYYTGEQIQRHMYLWGNYYNYYIGYLNVVGPFARLCGWFNEPGYFGTIGALVLIADNMNLKKKGNIAIFIAMIFTFSLAALMIIGGYMVTMAARKGKMFIALLAFLFAILIIIPAFLKDDPNFIYLVERLGFEDGKFKGDNRTENNIFIRLQKAQFEDPVYALFGYGSGALKKYGTLGILGLKVQIYLYGIVGILFTYGLLLLYALKKARGSFHATVFVIWFFISAYQRPYLFAPDYMLILLGGVAYIQSKYNKKRKVEEKSKPIPVLPLPNKT